jgi:hypothetical protein
VSLTRGCVYLKVYHPIRFESPLLPPNWEPDPTRVWESKWDVQLKEQNAATDPTGGKVSLSQWKTGMTADQVGATYPQWLNLMIYTFVLVAWFSARRDAYSGSTQVCMGLHIRKRS